MKREEPRVSTGFQLLVRPVWKGWQTYVEFEGLEGHSEATGHWWVHPQSLFDDATGVLHLLQGLNIQTVEVQPLLHLKEDTESNTVGQR